MISGRHNYGVSLMAQWKRTRQQCRGPRRCGFDSLGWEDALEEEMATHSSILAWKIHGQRTLVGYSPWGLKESNMTELT